LKTIFTLMFILSTIFYAPNVNGTALSSPSTILDNWFDETVLVAALQHALSADTITASIAFRKNGEAVDFAAQIGFQYDAVLSYQTGEEEIQIPDPARLGFFITVTVPIWTIIDEYENGLGTILQGNPSQHQPSYYCWARFVGKPAPLYHGQEPSNFDLNYFFTVSHDNPFVIQAVDFEE